MDSFESLNEYRLRYKYNQNKLTYKYVLKNLLKQNKDSNIEYKKILEIEIHISELNLSLNNRKLKNLLRKINKKINFLKETQKNSELLEIYQKYTTFLQIFYLKEYEQFSMDFAEFFDIISKYEGFSIEMLEFKKMVESVLNTKINIKEFPVTTYGVNISLHSENRYNKFKNNIIQEGFNYDTNFIYYVTKYNKSVIDMEKELNSKKFLEEFLKDKESAFQYQNVKKCCEELKNFCEEMYIETDELNEIFESVIEFEEIYKYCIENIKIDILDEDENVIRENKEKNNEMLEKLKNNVVFSKLYQRIDQLLNKTESEDGDEEIREMNEKIKVFLGKTYEPKENYSIKANDIRNGITPEFYDLAFDFL